MDFTIVYNFFGGRSTFFALAFFVVGCVLAFKHGLTDQYIALAAAIQTLLVTRAIMDDYHARHSQNANGASNGTS